MDFVTYCIESCTVQNATTPEDYAGMFLAYDVASLQHSVWNDS